MTRKRLMTGIALVGFVLALGSNAWAEHGRGGKDHRNDKGYHHTPKTPPGHHYGWDRGRGNPHSAGHPHRPGYRHRDRDHRRDHDGHRHHDRDCPIRKRVVEKHVYHHYRSEDGPNDDGFNVAVSVIDRVFSVAVAVSGRR